MADSLGTPDFYTVLQVHPDADQEIIEAAYRQLMKKHHPDVAGTDATLAAQHHQRAKLINQAHSVLRDPVQRRRYDMARSFGGPVAAPPPPDHPQARASRGAPASGVPSEGPAAWPESSQTEAPAAWFEAQQSSRSGLPGPLGAIAAAYYLLPGPYEWEGEHRQELLSTCLIPPVGVAAFALATGRLAAWVGPSMGGTLLAWGIVGLLLLPSWSSLPRLAVAGLPSALLLSGAADVVLRQANVPSWVAWAGLSFVSLVLSARLFVFAVLPTLGVCWLLSRLG
ncbi:MAG: DnaJ domain-containing protein [Chloroflexota bacterium]